MEGYRNTTLEKFQKYFILSFIVLASVLAESQELQAQTTNNQPNTEFNFKNAEGSKITPKNINFAGKFETQDLKIKAIYPGYELLINQDYGFFFVTIFVNGKPVLEANESDFKMTGPTSCKATSKSKSGNSLEIDWQTGISILEVNGNSKTFGP